MKYPPDHLEYLWKQYMTGKSTPDELEEFLLVIDDAAYWDEHWPLLEKIIGEHPEERALSATRQEELRQVILRPRGRVVEMSPPPRRRRWLPWTAASLLFILVCGVVLWRISLPKHADSGKPTSVALVNVPPGRTGALLTLSNGSTIVLDTLQQETIADGKSTRITVTDGQLRYGAGDHTPEAAVYNTVSTPKGRQFSLRLQDGTTVWLNAESSIRYPVAFNDKDRTVTISGEVYLEVAHGPARPFRVEIAGGGRIEVLGTAFNVNAYRNEGYVRTTLIEGRVRVTGTTAGSPAAPVVLKPGQQAAYAAGTGDIGQIKVISGIDLGKVTAWKLGAFDFQDVTLSEAMRQLERWYDIEVEIGPGVPADAPFYGQVSRDLSLQDLLRVFERSRLRFKIIEGRKLIISK